MKVVFLGVGEAFDDNLPNNSHIVSTDKTNLLLDCGFSIPQQLWRFNSNPNFLDAIYISHQHADHYFGLPAVLSRMWEDGREKDLAVICQKGFMNSFKEFEDLAFKGFLEKFKYKINFIEAREGEVIKLQDLNFSFEKTIHSAENLAIKISNEGKSIVYSGDGSPKEGDFYRNSDLLVQETYLYDQEREGHSSIVSAIKFAEKNDIKCLALTHINRNLRKNNLAKVKNEIEDDKVKIIIPEPLEEYNI